MSAAGPPRLFESIARLARTTVGLVRTRIEIVATELAEERIRLVQLVLAVAAIVFCLQLAGLLFVGLLVVVFWEADRLWVIGGFATALLVAGLVGLAILWHRLRTSKPFATTIAELAKDEARFEGDAR